MARNEQEKEMKKISSYEEFAMNEGYSENLNIILSSLKDASEDQIKKISNMLSKKLTWGNIVELAEVVHLENKIHK